MVIVQFDSVSVKIWRFHGDCSVRLCVYVLFHSFIDSFIKVCMNFACVLVSKLCLFSMFPQEQVKWRGCRWRLFVVLYD